MDSLPPSPRWVASRNYSISQRSCTWSRSQRFRNKNRKNIGTSTATTDFSVFL